MPDPRVAKVNVVNQADMNYRLPYGAFPVSSPQELVPIRSGVFWKKNTFPCFNLRALKRNCICGYEPNLSLAAGRCGSKPNTFPPLTPPRGACDSESTSLGFPSYCCVFLVGMTRSVATGSFLLSFGARSLHDHFSHGTLTGVLNLEARLNFGPTINLALLRCRFYFFSSLTHLVISALFMVMFNCVLPMNLHFLPGHTLPSGHPYHQIPLPRLFLVFFFITPLIFLSPVSG